MTTTKSPRTGDLDVDEVALTAMYLMNGIEEYLKSPGCTWDPDETNGHIGLAAKLAPYAARIERFVLKQAPKEWPGVFHYEVIEGLGRWLALHHAEAHTTFDAELKRRYDAFMSADDVHLPNCWWYTQATRHRACNCRAARIEGRPLV